MKKFGMTFGITLVALILLFVSFSAYQTSQDEVSRVTKERDMYMEKVKGLEQKYTEIQDLLTVITPETFAQNVSAGKEMFVYIGRPDCGDCSALEPKLIEYIKSHQEVSKTLIFVNVRTLRMDEAKWAQFKKEYTVAGTPHFAYWKDGKQISMKEWTAEKGFTINMFDVWARENRLVQG